MRGEGQDEEFGQSRQPIASTLTQASPASGRRAAEREDNLNAAAFIATKARRIIGFARCSLVYQRERIYHATFMETLSRTGPEADDRALVRRCSRPSDRRSPRRPSPRATAEAAARPEEAPEKEALN